MCRLPQIPAAKVYNNTTRVSCSAKFMLLLLMQGWGLNKGKSPSCPKRRSSTPQPMDSSPQLFDIFKRMADNDQTKLPTPSACIAGSQETMNIEPYSTDRQLQTFAWFPSAPRRRPFPKRSQKSNVFLRSPVSNTACIALVLQ